MPFRMWKGQDRRALRSRARPGDLVLQKQLARVPRQVYIARLEERGVQVRLRKNHKYGPNCLGAPQEGTFWSRILREHSATRLWEMELWT